MKTCKNLFHFLFLFLTLLVSCNNDDDCTQSTFYKDADGDGFGDSTDFQSACTQPEGYVDNSTDPNDTDETIFPGCTTVTFYKDGDGDGFGDSGTTQILCSQPDGFVLNNTDTDDTNAEIFPGCTETIYYQDSDGDGFGDPNFSQSSCVPIEGFVTDNTDCDDSDAEINPEAEDSPNDGIDSNCDGTEEANIWNGEMMVFTKASNVDWTLPENQDRLTEKVTFTRQNRGPMYNYQWWQDTFGEDAVHVSSQESDLVVDFWGLLYAEIKDVSLLEPLQGGTKGVRWALLDDTGVNNPNTSWENFPLYGQLGDPIHFYSFNNIAAIIHSLENDTPVSNVIDVFTIDNDVPAFFTNITNKRLGVWLVEEDIYLELTFTEWGSGNSGGSISYSRTTPNN